LLSEKQLSNQVLQTLKALGFFVWENKTMGTYDPSIGTYRKGNAMTGVPDILGILPDGKFLGIELKTQQRKGVVSDSQKAFLKRAEELNALTFVSNDLNHVLKTLEEKKYL
jgi:hypothetical protein